MNLVLLDAELRRDEGVRDRPYLDSLGFLTVGVGHRLAGSPLPAVWSYPLTDSQINQLLELDLKVVFDALDRNLPWWRALDEVRQRVVANMCFNLGITKLLGFKLALAAMQARDYSTATAEMKASAWHSQVGDRAVRLCTAMSTGVMPEINA